MKIIEGFTEAKAVLSRENPVMSYPISNALKRRLEDMFGQGATPELAVKRILEDVRTGGDSSVIRYTGEIDKVTRASLEMDKQEIKDAYNSVTPGLVEALNLAAERVKAFHQEQKESVCKGVSGKEWKQLVRPLSRVGVYAPGGTASYPSTVLMTAVPAKVAGVGEIILVTPPGMDGKVPAATLVAADIAKVDRVFTIGGAQAIGALAYGTESVPKVDKICGPGNIFVMLAKKMVYGVVDIDGLQGPSEVLIVADDSANPVYCAADMLAQAEHDSMASSVLVTTSRKLAADVAIQLKLQMARLPRCDVVRESIKDNGVMAVVNTLDEAIGLANLYAPEHLELMISDAEMWIDKIRNAGCVFAGMDSAVAYGDYIAGPSHVLPTGGTARFSSPLNVLDFIKLIDIVNIRAENTGKLGRAVITIARMEGLEAHAQAVEKRLHPEEKPSCECRGPETQ